MELTSEVSNIEQTESTPLIQTRRPERFHVSSLLSVMYGMVIYLLAIVIMTAFLSSLRENTNYVTADAFNSYTIALYVIAIPCVIGDIVYLRANALAPTDTEMSMASSLHVKGGIVTFGFISILMAFIEIRLWTNEIIFVTGSGMKIIFILVEMIYLINYSSVSVKRWSGLRRFGLMHVMITNFKDITTSIIIKSCDIGFQTSDYRNTSLAVRWKSIEPYLEVCRIQYYFIATAMLAIMWHSIGKEQLLRQVRTKDNNVNYSTWNTSIAVVLGFGVIILTIASIFISSGTDIQNYYYWIRIILNIITLFSVTVLFVVSRRRYGVFQQYTFPFQLDELIIELCLVFLILQEMYSVLSVIVEIWCSNMQYIALTVCDRIFTDAKVVIQSLLIVQSLRFKVTVPTAHWYKSMLLFLSMSNLAWWIITMTELKNDQHIYGIQKQFYGKNAYDLIHGITGPFVVFYYYQSSVCFFEMWMTNNRRIITVKVSTD
ncbi:proton channel OtopLc-like [Antedon mediterranea]|uniref:proton channel OtopLc-like n=1 Tax=Antedon mediterranea TaxID=105859 RepID=UPI003AF6B3BD